MATVSKLFCLTLRVHSTAVDPLAGPAIDMQQSVFALRRLPLAVGYQRTVDSLPFTLASPVAKQVTFKVTAIEPVEVTAGKFRCYKVSFGSLNQTFWIGIDGSRPLVKIQAGNIEADLVKIWGAENFIETELGFFRDAGWRFDKETMGPGPEGRAELSLGQGQSALRVSVLVTKISTPAGEIPGLLESSLHAQVTCEQTTIQNRVVGGQQAVSCIDNGVYRVFIRSETAFIEPFGGVGSMGVYRWQLDHALATAKRIP
jgi:hypothetical protein